MKLLQTEWAALATAPWSFAIFTAAACGLAFAACRWAYQSRHESSKERIDLLQERLKSKDGQLDEYRERLGLLPSAGNKYSKLTHQQLQEHTLKLVQDIRSWLAQSESETREAADRQWQALRSAQTEEQRHQLWQAHSSTLTNGIFSLIRDFEQKFKIEAILMRDELLTRLPATERSAPTQLAYEMPVNTFCIREVADDLERKAKILR